MHTNFTYFGSNPADPQLWADALRLDADNFSPGQFEWWYTDGHLSDGTTFVASFHLEIRENGICLPFMTLNFANQTHIIQDEKIAFEATAASFDPQVCDVRIGPHFFRSIDGFKKYEIFIDPDTNHGNGVHLILERSIPSYAPSPDDGVNPETPYFSWVCAVPNGHLSGTITLNGVEKQVTGSGYHDHNWGNCPMSVLVDDWHWARGEAAGHTAVAASVRFKNGLTLNNVYVAHPDKGVLVAEAVQNIEFLEGGKMEQPDTGKTITSDALYFVNGENDGYVRFKGKKAIA